ncbi:unnamed protein product, partial [Mesorhabditis spiculigera]
MLSQLRNSVDSVTSPGISKNLEAALVALYKGLFVFSLIFNAILCSTFVAIMYYSQAMQKVRRGSKTTAEEMKRTLREMQRASRKRRIMKDESKSESVDPVT